MLPLKLSLIVLFAASLHMVSGELAHDENAKVYTVLANLTCLNGTRGDEWCFQIKYYYTNEKNLQHTSALYHCTRQPYIFMHNILKAVSIYKYEICHTCGRACGRLLVVDPSTVREEKNAEVYFEMDLLEASNQTRLPNRECSLEYPYFFLPEMYQKLNFSSEPYN